MKKRIGIVGGGQLGRMLTDAAHKLGFNVVILDPTPDSPAGQVADRQIIGSFTDEDKIRELAKEVDYMTFEIESANAQVLDDLAAQGIQINPSTKTLSLIKDKLKQKEFLQQAGIPVAEFDEVETEDDIAHAGKKFGYPMLLKARLDAYDGRGNAVVSSEDTIAEALEKLHGKLLYVEKFVQFEKELSVMVARSTTGEITTYPVVENTHKNNILHTTVVPAAISKKSSAKAQRLAVDVMEHLKGAGVFGIEMFLTPKGDVLVNEIAPRVHNSGHYTIEACITSQFEQHIRAVTGMKLGPTNLIVGGAAMVNILGEEDRPAKSEGVEKASQIQGVGIHIYGKKESRKERKMGHITAVGNTPQEALEKALKAREYISI